LPHGKPRNWALTVTTKLLKVNPMPQITVKAGVGTTFLKTHPWQIAASAGKPEFKAFKCPEFNADKTRKTLAVNPTGLSQDIDGHAAITFDPPLTIGGNKYSKLFVAMCHWEGLDVLIKNKVAAATPFSAAGSGKLLLPVTYRSQVDDSPDTGQGPGYRHCQSVSATNLLEACKGLDWLLKTTKGFEQPEDWYTTQLTPIGDTTDPAAHVKLLTSLGIRCSFRTDVSIQDAKASIDRATGMTFNTCYKRTAPGGGGHVNYVVGKCLTTGGLYVHDPYGERLLTGKRATDEWVSIGGNGGDRVLFNLDVVKDAWLDNQGDGTGWAIIPDTDVYGYHYQKPSVTLSAAPAVTAPATTSPTITILQQTLLKKSTAASGTLSDADKRVLPPGPFTCEVVGAKENHGQVKLPDGSLWFIFNAHFKGQETAAGQNANTAPRDCCVDAAKLRSAVGKLANPNVPGKELDDFCAAFLSLAAKYTITKREHAIHFLAQCFHESGGMMYLEELASGDDYTDRDDLGNCRPEAIAAAKGMSVGAWFKGHSLIQTTGYDHHLAYGKAAGIDAVNNPQLLAEYPHALGAALYFWSSRGPSLSVDAEGGINDATCKAITKIVNGGLNGISDRLHYMDEFAKML
jgi:predicted chitinase